MALAVQAGVIEGTLIMVMAGYFSVKVIPRPSVASHPPSHPSRLSPSPIPHPPSPIPHPSPRWWAVACVAARRARLLPRRVFYHSASPRLRISHYSREPHVPTPPALPAALCACCPHCARPPARCARPHGSGHANAGRLQEPYPKQRAPQGVEDQPRAAVAHAARR